MATPSQERLKEDAELDKKGFLNLSETGQFLFFLFYCLLLTRTVESLEEDWRRGKGKSEQSESGRSGGKRKRQRGSSSSDCQQRNNTSRPIVDMKAHIITL